MGDLTPLTAEVRQQLKRLVDKAARVRAARLEIVERDQPRARRYATAEERQAARRVTHATAYWKRKRSVTR